MKNKKGVIGTQATVFWFLFLVFILVVGLAAGTYIFFGSQYDYRQIDADLINSHIKECLTENNISLNNETFKQEFYSTCRLHQDVVEKNFFVLVELDGKRLYEAGKGDRTQCALSDKNEEYPKCQNTTIIKEGKTIFIETGSNQKSRTRLE